MANSIDVSRQTPIHRDFYPDQIVIDSSRVTICDLDLYRLGDPALDVGNFAAHVLEQGLRERSEVTALGPVVDAFTFSYRALSPSISPIAIEAYTTLSLVRHIAIGTQMESRRAITEPLLEICESRLL